MSDLVGNPEDRFSQNEAQIMFVVMCFTVAFFELITANVEVEES